MRGCGSWRVRACFVRDVVMTGWLLLQKVYDLGTLRKGAGSLKGITASQLGKLSLFSSIYKEGSLY